jgi:molecular chaperone Hsp33
MLSPPVLAAATPPASVRDSSTTCYDGPRVSDFTQRYLARRSARAEAPSRFLDPAPALGEDTLWRGLTRNGELRLLVARATRTVREITATLGASAANSEMLAGLVLGGLLLRSTLDPDAQLQVTIRNRGRSGRLYLDVWPSGRGLRASLENPDATEGVGARLWDGGQLEMVRSRGAGPPYRSSRAFTRETLPELFMAHLLESDQIVALLKLDVRMDRGAVASAAGFLVQATPEGSRKDVARLLANLEGIPPLGDAMSEADPDARSWVDRLLDGYRWDQSAREPIAFVCRCSRERLLVILRALPDRDLDEMIASQDPIEIACEFCRKQYCIDPRELVVRRH